MRDNQQTLSPPWRRHDLLQVAPDAWASALAHSQSLADVLLVGDWTDRGWPVIVRRHSGAEDRNLVAIGIPLPSSIGKRRVALLIPPGGVLKRSLPSSLYATARVAAPSWQPTIDALLAIGTRSGVAPLAFGSLLWQHLTGLAYLTPHSDLDVLWQIPADVDVLSLVFSIAEVQRAAPMRIDGEIIFPDGSAVNWRELWNAHQASDQGMVLAKTMEGVRLLGMASLIGIGERA